MNSKFLASLFMIIVASIGIFGISLVMNEHAGGMTCPFSSILVNDCSSFSGMALITHHINGFWQMTQAVLMSPASIIILSLLFAIALIVVLRKRTNTGEELSLCDHRSLPGIAEKHLHKVKAFLFKWCALHNKYELATARGM